MIKYPTSSASRALLALGLERSDNQNFLQELSESQGVMRVNFVLTWAARGTVGEAPAIT